MTNSTIAATILLPISLSVAATHSGNQIADYLNGNNNYGLYSYSALPEGIITAIASDNSVRFSKNEAADGAVSYGKSLPPDVDEFLSLNGLHDTFRFAVGTISELYSALEELRFEVVNDFEVEESWVVIGIRTGLQRLERNKSYDRFIDAWVKKIDSDKRQFIHLEHLNA